MRWSEQYLQNHLKAKQNNVHASQNPRKLKNQAKVHGQDQNAIQAKTKRNRNGEENNILDCEIAAVPPSVNHYWEKSGRGFKLSDKARDFHDVVRLLVPAVQTAERLKMDVIFHFPDQVRRDIDNYLKATIDSLVKCGLCVDDEQFDELIVRRGEVVKGGLIRIKVWEI